MNKKYVEPVTDAIERGLIRIGLAIQAEAVLRAPVKDGRLRKSIDYQTNDSGHEVKDGVSKPNEDFTLNVGTSLEYAATQEYGGVVRPVNGKFLVFRPKGSRKPVFAKKVVIPAQPYLTPAYEKVKPFAKQIIYEEILKALGKK